MNSFPYRVCVGENVQCYNIYIIALWIAMIKVHVLYIVHAIIYILLHCK